MASHASHFIGKKSNNKYNVYKNNLTKNLEDNLPYQAVYSIYNYNADQVREIPFSQM